MTHDVQTHTLATSIDNATEAAVRAIPPAWPLAATVAVNPYLGQADESLAMVGARLARTAGLSMTMPRQWYSAHITSGAINDDDLEAALKRAPTSLRPNTLAALKAASIVTQTAPQPLPTIAHLAANVSGIDWPAIIADRFGAWAASWFDEGQALWAATKGVTAYGAWQAFATHDLSPEIAGLSGFAQRIVSTPFRAKDAILRATERLSLPSGGLDTYYHQLLLTLGGWSQFARYRLWQAELIGQSDTTLLDFLAIRLLFEEALLDQYSEQLSESWQHVCIAHEMPVTPTADLIIDQILQEAAEQAEQRKLGQTLATASLPIHNARPAFQAAFCIDVRSEVFRRALESLAPSIQTLGFAGFFGLTASHRRFASDVAELRLPVLLNPGVHSCSGNKSDEVADSDARLSARAKRAWGRFKLAAVSSFAFVEATGPIYVGKLVRDAMGLSKAALPNDPAPRFEPDLDLPARANAAESILRAMSLTSNFARIVLLAGHGASVTNNPHASALQCGACGGYSGEVNARLLAGLLNEPAVRSVLATNGIAIPEDTLFLGGLHDTTIDEVLLYVGDHETSAHQQDLMQVRSWLASARSLTRTERAIRLPRASNEGDIAMRSRDWAEIRPEWALADCKAFIAAPRERTKGKNLEGLAFLHDYVWQQDSGFGVLELIMTAPVVVASWISLQYYGSTVAPTFFGSGNKLLHNVAGGFGVVEGNGGVLRAGLPWQSVHDGQKLIHNPLRLTVCIEAPVEAMTDILARHAGVKALFDNKWLYLFALDQNGHMAQQYVGDLQWEKVGKTV